MLDSECDGVHQASDVDVQHAEIGALEAACDGGIIVNPSALIDARNTVHVVDTAMLSQSLPEDLGLLVPITDIDLSRAGHIPGLVELGTDGLCTLSVLISNEDLYAEECQQ